MRNFTLALTFGFLLTGCTNQLADMRVPGASQGSMGKRVLLQAAAPDKNITSNLVVRIADLKKNSNGRNDWAAHPELRQGKQIATRNIASEHNGKIVTNRNVPAGADGSFMSGTQIFLVNTVPPASGNSQVGFYAEQSIYSGYNINAPYNSCIYSPTLQGANYDDLECTTVYINDNASYPTTTSHYFGIWNHASGVNRFVYYEPIDSNWMSTYAHWNSELGCYTYETEILKGAPGDTGWYACLKNQVTHNWETKVYYQWSDPYAYDRGWNTCENYVPSSSCPAIPSFRSEHLMVWDGQNWHYVDSTYGYGDWGYFTSEFCPWHALYDSYYSQWHT